MEVAQIGRGIVLQLKKDSRVPKDDKQWLPSVPVIESICFAHDLGHPPFGHRGELVLDYLMRDHGGFEANAETLRILSRDELHTHGYGLDPTRRVLLGVLKYPATRSSLQPDWRDKPPTSFRDLTPDNWKITKCYYDEDQEIVDFITKEFSAEDVKRLSAPARVGPGQPRKTDHKSLDAWIMDVADEIAYAVHDLEDGIELGLITSDHWKAAQIPLRTWKRLGEIDKQEPCIEKIEKYLCCEPDLEYNRKLAIGRLIKAMVESVVMKPVEGFDEPVLSFKVKLCPGAEDVRQAMQQLVQDHVIDSQNVQTVEHGGQHIVGHLFEAIVADPKRLLKANYRERLNGKSEAETRRVVCSYVAGLTDNYACRLYERLFLPRHGSVFERL